jgi:hypothetical protein
MNDDEVRFVLDQHAELDLYSASSLKQQSTSRHVAPLGHIILIPNQPVFVFLLNAACLAHCLWFDPIMARTHDLPNTT